MKFYYEYAGEKIPFTSEEIAKIKTFGEPGNTDPSLAIQRESDECRTRITWIQAQDIAQMAILHQARHLHLP